MPQRITNVAVTLHREGKRIELKAGVLHNFTNQELEDLKALNPDVVRLPRNESVTIDGESTIVDDGENGDGTKTQIVKAAKAAGNGKKPTAAEKKAAADAALKEEGSDPKGEGEDTNTGSDDL